MNLGPGFHAAVVLDEFGCVTVVDPAQLFGYLADDEEYEEAVNNSAFDSLLSARPADAQILGLLQRVHQLNATGDVDAYWNPPTDPADDAATPTPEATP